MPVVVQKPFRQRNNENITSEMWSSIEKAVEPPAAIPEEWDISHDKISIQTRNKISVPTPPPKILSPSTHQRSTLTYKGSPFFKHSKKMHKRKKSAIGTKNDEIIEQLETHTSI